MSDPPNSGGPMDAEAIELFTALRRQLREHPLAEARQRWDGLRTTAQIVVDNGAALRSYITHHEDVAAFPAQAEQATFFSILLRHLSNYVSSAHMLVDHARNVVRDYQRGEFTTEYDARKDALAGESVTSLIKALRNFQLHRGHPAVGIQLRSDASGTSVRLILETGELRAWEKCPAPARHYLNTVDEVSLLSLVDQHEALLKTFYTWLFSQYVRLHEDDIKDYEQLKARHDESVRRRPEG